MSTYPHFNFDRFSGCDCTVLKNQLTIFYNIYTISDMKSIYFCTGQHDLRSGICFCYATTVVPATAGQRSFRGKMALRGRWPLVTGNGHMRHYVKSNTHIYFTANAQHFKAQRSITVLYTVRDETNNAENV